MRFRFTPQKSTKKIVAQHYYLVNDMTLTVTVHRQIRAVSKRPYK